jgi:hypothetical protein
MSPQDPSRTCFCPPLPPAIRSRLEGHGTDLEADIRELLHSGIRDQAVPAVIDLLERVWTHHFPGAWEQDLPLLETALIEALDCVIANDQTVLLLPERRERLAPLRRRLLQLRGAPPGGPPAAVAWGLMVDCGWTASMTLRQWQVLQSVSLGVLELLGQSFAPDPVEVVLAGGTPIRIPPHHRPLLHAGPHFEEHRLAAALRHMRRFLGLHDEPRKLLLLVTLGAQDTAGVETLDEARELRRAGIRLMPVVLAPTRRTVRSARRLARTGGGRVIEGSGTHVCSGFLR